MSVVEGLVQTYPGFTLEIPRWEIADQGITALWGPSGSGKTTAFRILIGLDPCATLRWNFKGEDLARLSPPDRQLGVVFQTLELFPHMTAAENILFAARARRLSEDESRTRLKSLADDLHLGNCLERKASVLSGGEAQRVALARAVIAHPRFLFLDEPFSSLDAQLKSEARTLVKNLIGKLGIPTLLITHDEQDLSALASSVVRLRDGRLVSG
jgi:ABC-type sulfate/molybdate transport systems ATPase subunit